MAVCWVVLILLLISYGYTETLLTPIYGSGANTITKHIALNQGRIYSIQNWAVSPGGIGPRIKLWQWYANNQSVFTDYGSGANHQQCDPFTLNINDYIVGYTIWVDHDIYGLQFHSRNGNIYSCIGDDTKQIYSNSYNFAMDDFWYLTGWKIQDGAIIDQIQFQFTKAIIRTNTPTEIPTNYPSKIPTNIPTLSPSLSPSNNPSLLPTISPTINRTHKLPYNLTNGCVTKLSQDDDIIYIFGGYNHMIKGIYSEQTEDILVWNTSTSALNKNEFNIQPWNIKSTSSVNCHQNTVYSSLLNDIYIAGALSVYWYKTGRFNETLDRFIYVTSTYYIFDVTTLEYKLFSPDGSKGNQRLIRSCTSLMESEHLLLTVGGQLINDFLWMGHSEKDEFKLRKLLDSMYNTTNMLQIFNLSNYEWIEGDKITNTPFSLMESGCIAIGQNLLVFGGKTVENGELHSRSEILRFVYKLHGQPMIFNLR